MSLVRPFTPEIQERPPLRTLRRFTDPLIHPLPASQSEKLALPPSTMLHASKENEHDDLPLPNTSLSSKKKSRKIRFQSSVKGYWELFKRRLAQPIPAPNESTETTTNDTSGESFVVPSRFVRLSPRRDVDDEGEDEDDLPYETIVVDNVLFGEGAMERTEGTVSSPSVVGSQNEDHTPNNKHNDNGSVSMSVVVVESSNSSRYFRNIKYSLGRSWIAMVYRIVRHFFDMKFHDPDAELTYQKDHWAANKIICFMSSLFYILSWVLILALGSRPWSQFNYISSGVIPALTIPLPIIAFFDFPRKHRRFWQIYSGAATWYFACINVLDIRLCNFYRRDISTCGTKDFLGAFYFATAFPGLSLFTMGGSRLTVVIGATIWTNMAAALVIPYKESWVRLIISEVVYYTFLVFAHFLHERSDREIFSIREQLKVQWKAVQRSQAAESKANDSKRRYISYIFHEVRVPLNAASLTASELEQSAKDPALFQEDLRTLVGSLETMRTILDDVLDLNRMDAGRFLLSRKPFDWGHLITSIINTEQRTAKSKDLTLKVELDPQIENLAIKSIKSAWMEMSKITGEVSEVSPKPIVVGDEQRLRQVVSNLFSNALKFTQKGGTITFRTKLLYPPEDAVVFEEIAGSKKIVVRIEIEDTGCGIKKSDLLANKLFSPFSQTEKGLEQGGKGTGLGLSLVRQLIKVYNGRLGVKSKIGVGSTFWVELVFGVGVPDNELNRKNRMEAFSDLYAGETGASSFLLPPVSYFAKETTMSTLSSVSALSTNFEAPELFEKPILKITEQKKSTLTSSVAIQNSVDRSLCPTTSPSPQTQPAIKTSPLSSPLSTVPIQAFVVDDDAVTRKLMCRILHKAQVHVEEASNGQIALDRLLGSSSSGYLGPPDTHCSNPSTRPTFDDKLPSVPPGEPKYFDVVFLDFHMPVKTGATVVKELRERGRTDLVVGVTANGLRGEQDAYLEAGCTCVLTKPINAEQLRAIITAIRERRISLDTSIPVSPLPPPPVFVPG